MALGPFANDQHNSCFDCHEKIDNRDHMAAFTAPDK
jgi:hypothetical protein